MVDPVRGIASNGASEAKDPGATSKPGTQPGSTGALAQPQSEPASSNASQGEPEVQILEEHVTHAAQKPVPPGASQGEPAQSAAPAPVPPAPAPVVESAPAPKPVAAPAPVPPPAAIVGEAAPIPPENLALGTDIAKILSSVKLPERRLPAQAGAAVLQDEKKTTTETKKFDTSIVGRALDDGAKTPSPAIPSLEEMKVMERNPSSVAAVHTLKDDLQGVVHDQKISVVRAVSLEEDRKAHRGPMSSETAGTQQRSNRTFGILFASLTLLLLGGGALFGVFFVMNKQRIPPQIETGSSILFAEQSVLLSLDAESPAELKRALETGRATSQGALGSITRIIPVTAATSSDGTPQKRPATFREFMAAIGARPSDSVLRALGSDFFLGIHAVDKSAPLIVIPVVSHARAFEAMLGWEASLNADLTPLFSAVPAFTQDQNGVPTRRTYEDLVMRNYDVRALKDDAGDIQLYYSFPTQNILIIAESPYSFPEILSRLQASRQL